MEHAELISKLREHEAKLEERKKEWNRLAAVACGYECRASVGKKYDYSTGYQYRTDEWYNPEGEFEGEETPDFCGDRNLAAVLVEKAASEPRMKYPGRIGGALRDEVESGQHVMCQPMHWQYVDLLTMPPYRIVRACLLALGLIREEEAGR